MSLQDRGVIVASGSGFPPQYVIQGTGSAIEPYGTALSLGELGTSRTPGDPFVLLGLSRASGSASKLQPVSSGKAVTAMADTLNQLADLMFDTGDYDAGF